MKQLRLSYTWLIGALFMTLWACRWFLVPRYFERTAQLGYYPPEADAIILPIVGNCFSTILLSPIWLIFLWLTLRQSPQTPRWFAWNRSRWGWSLFWTSITIVFIYASLESMVENIRISLPVNAIADALWACAWFLLRGVVVSRLKAADWAPNKGVQGTPDVRSQL